MTASTLKTYTVKDLAQMARSEGVTGWHSMRKDELIAELVRAARRRRSAKSRNGSKSLPTNKANGSAPKAPKPTKARRRIQERITEFNRQKSELKNLGSADIDSRDQDRLVVLVRDPYWLHACWELSQNGVDRAKSALGQHWHTAEPVLRVHRIESDGGSKLASVIKIHGGVTNWYVSVQQPPCKFRMEIGYQPLGKDFYCLARSNTVSTPAPGSAETVDRNWDDVADNADRIFAMSGGYSADGASIELQELLEERLRRRLGRPSETRFGAGAAGRREEELHLAIDAELVVYGSTDPHTHVTVKGEPVPVSPDGTFAIKMHLPDRRQVVPIVAGSADGVEQKTIILGVERNTKVLDPVLRETAT